MYLPLLADKLNGKKINFTTAYIQKAPKPEIVEDDPVPAVPLGSQYDRRGRVGLARDPGAVEHERGQEYTNYHHHHCGDLERERESLYGQQIFWRGKNWKRGNFFYSSKQELASY